MDLGNILTVSANPVTLPTAELLFPVAKADKLLATAVASQAVWLTAAGFVPPCGAAVDRTESLLLFAWNLKKWIATVFACIRIRLWHSCSLYAAAMADGFYGVGGE